MKEYHKMYLAFFGLGFTTCFILTLFVSVLVGSYSNKDLAKKGCGEFNTITGQFEFKGYK